MVEIKYLLSRHVDCDDYRGMKNRYTHIRIIINLNKQSLWNQDKSKQDEINHKTVKTKKGTPCFPNSSPDQKGNRGVCSEFFFIVHKDHILSGGASFSRSHCHTGCTVTRMLFRVICPS